MQYSEVQYSEVQCIEVNTALKIHEGGGRYGRCTLELHFIVLVGWIYQYPILDTRISVCPFVRSCVTLRVPPLDSETGRTGEVLSKTKRQN